LPIPTEVINRVNEIGKSTGDNANILWEYVNGDEIADDVEPTGPVPAEQGEAIDEDNIINEPIDIDGVYPNLVPGNDVID
jgi:hypothetical protein